jgi:ABC-2 type transport system ATP-binding protein
VTQIKARNLSAAALHEVRDVILRHGGEDITVDHPTTTLEELFLRIVQESELHPGRRKVAKDAGRTATSAKDELAAPVKT